MEVNEFRIDIHPTLSISFFLLQPHELNPQIVLAAGSCWTLRALTVAVHLQNKASTNLIMFISFPD
jgi:hypothetical protein